MLCGRAGRSGASGRFKQLHSLEMLTSVLDFFADANANFDAQQAHDGREEGNWYHRRKENRLHWAVICFRYYCWMRCRYLQRHRQRNWDDLLLNTADAKDATWQKNLVVVRDLPFAPFKKI